MKQTKLKSNHLDYELPLYVIVVSEKDILVWNKPQLPLLESSILLIGNPASFSLQILWDMPKPEPESELRNYHLARVMAWLKDVAEVGEVIFGIGHILPEAIESIEIREG